jgi:hypothetical protein
MNQVTVSEQVGTECVGGEFEIGGVKNRIVWIRTEGLESAQVKPTDDDGTW